MKNRKGRIWIAAAIVCVLASLLAVSPVLAFESREGRRVVIGADVVIEDDLFVGAESFVLDGRVKGDLFVAGSDITINGVVEGDLWAGGQLIVINGELQDDAWLAAYAMLISPNARIGDDLRAAGYSLEAQAGSRVEGAFMYGGYQALLAGEIGEEAQVGCFGLAVDGTIAGDLIATVGPREQGMAWNPSVYNPQLPRVPSVPGGLTLGSDGRIGGDLDYTAADRAVVPAGVVAGRVNFTYDPPVDRPDPDISPIAVFGSLLVGWIVNTLRRLMAMLIVGLLVAWLAPRWLIRLSDTVRARTWPSLGWGALVFLLFPLALLILGGILLMVVVVLLLVALGNLGGPVALVGGAALLVAGVLYTLIVTYLTKIVAGYMLGRLFFPKEEWAGKPILPTLVGILFVVVVTRIPVIGWLISLAISLFGLGAIALWVAKTWGKRRASE